MCVAKNGKVWVQDYLLILLPSLKSLGIRYIISHCIIWFNIGMRIEYPCTRLIAGKSLGTRLAVSPILIYLFVVNRL